VAAGLVDAAVAVTAADRRQLVDRQRELPFDDALDVAGDRSPRLQAVPTRPPQ